MMMTQPYPHPGQLNAVPQHAVQPQMHAGPPGQPNAVALQHLNPHQGLAPGMNPQMLQQQQYPSEWFLPLPFSSPPCYPTKVMYFAILILAGLSVKSKNISDAIGKRMRLGKITA